MTLDQNQQSQFLTTPPALTSAYQQVLKMNEQIYHPQTEDDYNLIPMGAYFVDPEDFQIYQKNPHDEQQQPAEKGLLT